MEVKCTEFLDMSQTEYIVLVIDAKTLENYFRLLSIHSGDVSQIAHYYIHNL